MNQSVSMKSSPAQSGSRWFEIYVCSALSAGLLSLCFLYPGLFWLAWVALIPWLVSLLRSTTWHSFSSGFLFAILFYRITADWVIQLTGPYAAIGIIVFSLITALTVLTSKWICCRYGPWALLVCLPLFFAGQEILRAETFSWFRFAYGVLGYSQGGWLWLTQIASLGGVYFITFLVVSINVACACGIVSRHKRRWWPAATFLLITVVLGYISQPTGLPSGPVVPVAGIQIETDNVKEILPLLDEAFAADPRPRLVVLPEHTLFEYVSETDPIFKQLESLAQTHQAYICIGAHFQAPRRSKCDFDNTSIIIGPQGGILLKQLKMMPVPFFYDGNPAKELNVLQVPEGTLGTYICYDHDFTDYTRRLVNSGAEILLVPVMNAAHWPGQQRKQQEIFSRFRCIESRRAMVRPASSGTSLIVDTTGRFTAIRYQGEGAGVISGMASFNREITFFAAHGYLFNNFASMVFFAGNGIILTAMIINLITDVLARCLKKHSARSG